MIPVRARHLRLRGSRKLRFASAAPVILATMLAGCSGASQGPTLPAMNAFVGLACATGYQKINVLQPTGYADQQMGPDAWRVLARGRTC